MKRRFTILTAALALLVTLAIPMGVWGQSTVTFDATTDITENAQAYQTTELTINAADGSTWTANGYGATANTNIVIGKGGANYLRTPAVEGTITSVAVTWSGNANYYLALQTSTGTELEAKSNPSELTTETFTVSGSYNQLQLVGRRGSGTSNAAATITNVVVTYTPGSTPQPTTYTVTYNANVTGVESVVDTYDEGATVTLRPANTFTYEGYTFSEWNTQADGDGDAYDAGEEIENIQGNIELYAIWTENTTPTPVDIVIYDFSTTNNFLTEYPGSTHPSTGTGNNLGTFYYTNGDAFVASGTNRYFNSGYFMLGKTGATLQLPTFDFDVEKIVITGRSGASSSVVQNIYVGDQAVSTATTGATGENTYYIASGYQSAGTYTLKVTSNHNTQITKIEVYRKSDSSVSIPTFTPASGTYVEAQTVSIACETEGASIVYKYTENGEWQPYSQALTISETTTIWAKATMTGLEDSEVVSATYTIVSIEHEGTEADPYTVADARNSIDANVGVDGVYATGIVSAIVEEYNSQYGNVTFDIVDEVGSTITLRAYRCTGDYADDVAVNDVVVIYGDLTKYGNTYEFAQGCEIVSLTSPSYPIINVEQESITLAYDVTSGAIAYSIQNVENAIANAVSSESWLTIGTITSTSIALSCSANNGDADRTATVTLSYTGAESVEVTVTQGHYMAPGNWVLTSLSELTEDDIFVIVGTINGGTYALPSTSVSSQNAPAAVAVNIVEGTLSGEPDEELQFNLVGNATDGYTFYVNGNHEKWLYCSTEAASGSNNNIKVGIPANVNRNVFVLDEDNYLVTNDENVDRYLSIYVNNGTAQDWRGYINTNSAAVISFYKKVYTLDITGYGESAGGYYLIASPVTVNPANVEGMTEGHFDLFRFNESADYEWENWKVDGDHYHFNLVPGQGYLYAHKTDVTLTFTGTPYNGEPIILSKTDGDGIDWPGWNLVGNPYGVMAYLDRDFYTMNDAGDEIVAATNNSVQVMEGVFVIANSNGEELTFSTEAPAASGEKIVVNVSNTNGTLLDRAMIRFGEGDQLPKFQINENSTKLYINEGEEEFAVVRCINESSTPVSFRPAENGTYTLSINTENVEMEYLHLIDNLTGADIDLLATPSYTFESNTTDNVDRFAVVYTATTSVNENNAKPFAFFNGSEWVIMNEGNATMQVVDVTGRVISTETLNGNATINLIQVPGVYMIRLVNGNDVKVQKVVVK